MTAAELWISATAHLHGLYAQLTVTAVIMYKWQQRIQSSLYSVCHKRL